MAVRTKAGLRIVAIFEAAKGALVLAGGMGILSLLNKDAEEVAEHIVRQLRLDPTARYAAEFIRMASKATNQGIWLVAGSALVYSLFRFLEAYGLWKERTWAEWLAAVSGGLYIPFEVIALCHHPTWVKAGLLIVNVAIVAYITAALVKSRSTAKKSAA